MKDDVQLLREFVATHSESAFAELVQRHVNLVYSAALRQVNGDAHLAQDVTQVVFADLVRKASRLLGHTSLSGWLYTSIRFTAINMRRASQRRQDREQKALAMRELLETQHSEPNWDELKPALDDAMHALGEKDRHALLLRYFEGKTLAEVGHALGLNENAARKRVDRSVEKLRSYFSRRGICITAAGLAAIVNANAVVAAPAGLAAAIATTSLAVNCGSSLTLIKIVAMTKLKIAAALVAAGMTTVIVVQHQTNAQLRATNDALQKRALQIPALVQENDRLSKALTNNSSSLAENQLNELLKLRGQVGMLKKQLTDASKTRATSAQQPKATSADEESESPERTLAIQKLNCAKQVMFSFFLFAEDSNGMFPTNLEQAATKFQSGMTDDVRQWTNSFEIVYQGSIKGVTNPANTIVLREKEPMQINGRLLKTYGFADGHSEIHTEPDGNFEAWENARIQKN